MAGPYDIRAAAKAILRDGKIVEAEPVSVVQHPLDAGDASALVTGDLEPGARIRGERAALIQGAAKGAAKDPCRLEMGGDVVIEGGAEGAQVSARRIWVGGPVRRSKLVARDEIVVLEDVADSILVGGELSEEKRRVHGLREAVRQARERISSLERQLAVNQKRLGSAIERSSFEFEFSAGQVCRLSRDRIEIHLGPFYGMLKGKSDAEVDRALLEFFTKGVVGYLARVNRKQILDNTSRQKVFVTLTRSLHEVFLQSRERDKHRAAAEASAQDLEALLEALQARETAMHVGGEVLPGADLQFTVAKVDKEGEIDAVSAGLRVGPGPDDDHREVVHTNPKGEEKKQIVTAESLQGATLRLQDGRVVWRRGAAEEEGG